MDQKCRQKLYTDPLTKRCLLPSGHVGWESGEMMTGEEKEKEWMHEGAPCSGRKGPN